jgi:hypothetical protein
LYPSRIIVFSLLALALVAAGFDLVARMKQSSAFGVLQPYVDEDPAVADSAGTEPCTPSQVKKLVGREPDAKTDGGAEKQETYSWQGVFNRYHVHAFYGGVTLATDDAAEAEPLLLRVEKSSNYIWQ